MQNSQKATIQKHGWNTREADCYLRWQLEGKANYSPGSYCVWTTGTLNAIRFLAVLPSSCTSHLISSSILSPSNCLHCCFVLNKENNTKMLENFKKDELKCLLNTIFNVFFTNARMTSKMKNQRKRCYFSQLFCIYLQYGGLVLRHRAHPVEVRRKWRK